MVDSHHTRNVLLITTAVLCSVVLLSGCGGSSSSGQTTSASASRSDSTLQSLANSAWSDAGYTGQTATAIDTSNGGAVGASAGALALDTSDSAQTSAGLSVTSIGNTPQAIAQSLSASGPALVTMLNRSLSRPLQTVTLNGTVSCTGGGTASVSGTASVIDNGTSTSVNYSVALTNVQITLSQCSDGTDTATGSILLNTNNSVSGTLTGTNSGTFTVHLDDYLDGGLAYFDGSNYYNPTFRYQLLGTVSLVVSNSTVTSSSGSVTATINVNAIQCQATATFNGSLQPTVSGATCTAT